jgi:hypothetical protein
MTAWAWIMCFGIGALLGYWLRLANSIANKVGLRWLRSDARRLNHYHIASGATYCLLLLLGLAVCFGLTYQVGRGVRDSFWALIFGLAVASAVEGLAPFCRRRSGQ